MTGASLTVDETEAGVSFSVRVVTRAAKSALVGEHDGALRVRIAAAPVDGAANEELIAVLAKAFHVPKRAVSIVAGQTSKQKRVRIEGISAGQLRTILADSCR